MAIQERAKLFIGLIFADDRIYSLARRALEKKFGRSDFESQALPFNHTRYYQREFGENLKRRFLGFAKLQRPEKLARIKIVTNKIERRFVLNGRRRINIDPGILNLGKVILASTKDHKQRIYLGGKIFAEVTLYYQDKSFRFWECTYPDYRTPEYIQIFNSLRNIYASGVRRRR